MDLKATQSASSTSFPPNLIEAVKVTFIAEQKRMHAIKIGLSVSLGTCIWAFLGEKVASVTQLTYVTQLIFFTQFANVTVGSVGIHVTRLTYATHLAYVYIGYTVGLCYTVGLRYTLAYLDLAAGDRYGCCCCETVDDRMWNIIDEKSCFHNIRTTQ